jgi:hypothetical protein
LVQTSLSSGEEMLCAHEHYTNGAALPPKDLHIPLGGEQWQAIAPELTGFPG